MIISNKYKFIFVKTQKTAGTSIEVFLSQFCSASDIITPIAPAEEGHKPRNYKGFWNPFREIVYYLNFLKKNDLRLRYRAIRIIWKHLKSRQKFHNHIPAYCIKQRVPLKIWKNYFKFCVERNPWDKTVSHYYYRKYRDNPSMTFQDYLDMNNLCFNYNLYTDFNNRDKIIVDKVIKYENLTEELNMIFNRLAIPFNGSLGVRAKSNFRKDRKPYQEFFSEKYKKVIEKEFHHEIKMHKYSF